jgi:hypothetical protein
MTTPDPHRPDNISPDPTSPDPGSAGLPPTPWILLDRTTATQAATVLDRLEQWLAGGGTPDAVEACARACSLEEDDAFTVAAWLGALASRLEHRIAETDAGEAGSWS